MSLMASVRTSFSNFKHFLGAKLLSSSNYIYYNFLLLLGWKHKDVIDLITEDLKKMVKEYEPIAQRVFEFSQSILKDPSKLTPEAIDKLRTETTQIEIDFAKSVASFYSIIATIILSSKTEEERITAAGTLIAWGNLVYNIRRDCITSAREIISAYEQIEIVMNIINQNKGTSRMRLSNIEVFDPPLENQNKDDDFEV
jgi:hypothetical protein